MKINKILALALLMTSSICGFASNEKGTKLTKPTREQMAFMDMEIGAFFHYGMNVYTGDEHGSGQASPMKFNPTNLDVDQWVKAAKALGAKYAVLTVRHEDGFCLWPTKTNDYSIAYSSYKGGKGDIAKEFADACRKYGLKLGFYFSAMYDAHDIFKKDDVVKWGKEWDQLFDKNYAAMSDSERKHFADIQVNQLTELLTNYGEVSYIWNDHWGNYMAPDIQKRITDTMRKLQPKCLMLGPDVTTPGNETGRVVYPCWNTMDTEDDTNYTRAKVKSHDKQTNNNYGLLEGDVLTGDPFGKFWRSRECTTTTAFNFGGWFWHPGRMKARGLDDHINLYYRSVGLGANTIINLPPDNRGLVPDDIVKAAEVFGKEISKRFSNPIAKTNRIVKNKSYLLKWQTPKEINTVVTQENIINGQRIAAYKMEAMVNGKWQAIVAENYFNAPKPYSSNPGFETIGHKKIDRIKPVVTNMIRVTCTKSVEGTPEFRSMAVYNCPQLK